MDLIFSILRFLGILFLVVMVFNLMIVVHEWGHFLAGRWRKLKIDRFQIWFGKPIWSKNINGVQYGLGWIPFGGFVSLPQMAPMEMIEGQTTDAKDGDAAGDPGPPPEPLPPIKPLDKIIVAFAGPLFSFLLACFFAVIVYFVGYPDRATRDTTIGFIAPDAPAYEAGLRAGDRIVAIDGSSIDSWDANINSVLERLAFSQGDTIQFTIERPGEPAPLVIESGFERDPGGVFRRSGLRNVGAVEPKARVFVADLVEHGPAQRAGLRAGDEIVTLDGETIYSFRAVIHHVQNRPDDELVLGVRRNGVAEEIHVTPEQPLTPANATPSLGVQFGFDPDDLEETLSHPAPVRQVTDSMTMIFRTLGSLVSPSSDVGLQNLAGPVKIANLYYRLFEMPDGWRLVLWFSVILNVNLAILNMLPLPVLDGGHITLATIEAIRRGPVNFRALELVQTFCALALLLFMLYITWFDGLELIPGRGGGPEPMSFPPPDAAGEIVPATEDS